MATTSYDVPTAWDSSARYNAASDVDVLLSNHNNLRRLYFTITTSTSTPSVAIRKASFVEPGTTKAMQLVTGEYLWLAAETESSAALEV